MNNIELQQLRRDTKKIYGVETEAKIDKMNSGQLDKLKSDIDKEKQKMYPSHAELRRRKIQANRFPGLVGDKPPLHSKKVTNQMSSNRTPVVPATPFIRTGKPSVLMITDVRDWAWWIKSQYLKKYLSDEFDIHIINVIGAGSSSDFKNLKDYDIFVTFGYSFIKYLNNVPITRRVTGVTAHRAKGIIIGMMKKAKYVHANSMLLKNQLEEWGLKNVYYLPNGVDEEMFKPEVPIPVGKGEIVIGHVGKKSPNKGQDQFILPAIKKTNVNQFFHFNNYTDSIPHSEMPKLYQKFDVYICSSYEDGTPNPALESAACGRPILSNRIGNMPEFVKDGYNGFLVDQKVDAYVEKIEWFKKNKDEMIRMGENARKTVLEGWSWKIQSENYRMMFRDILEGG